jgi:hypothetical protein
LVFVAVTERPNITDAREGEAPDETSAFNRSCSLSDQAFFLRFTTASIKAAVF